MTDYDYQQHRRDQQPLDPHENEQRARQLAERIRRQTRGAQPSPPPAQDGWDDA